MEEFQVKENEQQEVALKVNSFDLRKALLIASISVLSLAIIAEFVNTSLSNKELRKEFSALNAQISDLNTKIDGNADKVTATLKDQDDKTKNLQTNVNDLKNRETVLRIEGNFIDGVVTDELFIHKITFTPSSLPKVEAMIDVDTQPTTTFKYQGKGKFNMTDRELGNMVSTLLDQAKGKYNGVIDLTKLNSNKWETGEFTVTIKNYEIGKYKDGVFTVTKASSLN